MQTANDIRGTVFQNGQATLLARVVDADGEAIAPGDIASLRYSIFQLDAARPNHLVAVEGHLDVALTPGEVFFDTLQTDYPWNLDLVGYNFRHEVDTSSDEAFPHAQVDYQVRYVVQPTAGPKVVFRFLLRSI